jgi:hypothetical protein
VAQSCDDLDARGEHQPTDRALVQSACRTIADLFDASKKSAIRCQRTGHKACRGRYSALYTRAAALFRDLAIARADGGLRMMLAKLSRIDLLVIDDWAMAPLSEPERRDFWEICEDRYQTRSMILTSQLPVSRWHPRPPGPQRAPHRRVRDSMRKRHGT